MTTYTARPLARPMSARAGFTLIELLVVIVVLAILMAIAIPTLLNQRKKAWDTDTRSNVANVYKAMKSGYVDGQAYTSAAVAEAIGSEPSISVTTSGTDYPEGAVKVAASDQTAVMTSKSKSGKYFCTVAIESGAGAGITRWEDNGTMPNACPATSGGTGGASSGSTPVVIAAGAPCTSNNDGSNSITTDLSHGTARWVEQAFPVPDAYWVCDFTSGPMAGRDFFIWYSTNENNEIVYGTEPQPDFEMATAWFGN